MDASLVLPVTLSFIFFPTLQSSVAAAYAMTATMPMARARRLPPWTALPVGAAAPVLMDEEALSVAEAVALLLPLLVRVPV